jgi:hypothetical protein
VKSSILFVKSYQQQLTAVSEETLLSDILDLLPPSDELYPGNNYG